jgi:hypothetical protein
VIIPSFLAKKGWGDTTNTTTWRHWNETYSTSADTYTIATDYSSATDGNAYVIWRHWNGQWISAARRDCATLLSATETGDNQTIEIWQEWNISAEAKSAQRRASAEQREQWRLYEEQRKQENEKREREWKEAQKRAEELLRSCLTPQQVEELDQKHHFHLLVGTRKYRVNRGRTRNIELIDEQGKVVKRLCAHPQDLVPDADTMLAQKLMLETNEQEFLKIANHS